MPPSPIVPATGLYRTPVLKVFYDFIEEVSNSFHLTFIGRQISPKWREIKEVFCSKHLLTILWKWTGFIAFAGNMNSNYFISFFTWKHNPWMCKCFEPRTNVRLFVSKEINKSATPNKFMSYKHSLLLHRLYNTQEPKAEWTSLNFNQQFSSRSNLFGVVKTNELKQQSFNQKSLLFQIFI